MINLFPDYQDYDDYGYSPYDRRAMELQRRRQIEAAAESRRRRRAAAEEEGRRRAMYRQAMMEQQRRAEELQRRKLAEEEENRRRMRILERAEAERSLRGRRQLELQRAAEEEEEGRRQWHHRQRQKQIRAKQQPRTAIVRGRDGRLYRVQLDDEDVSMDENYSMAANAVKPKNSATMSTNVPAARPMKTYSCSEDRMKTGSLAPETSKFYTATEEENAGNRTPAQSMHDDSDDPYSAAKTITPVPVSSNTDSKEQKNHRRRKKAKKITVVVEDASDSEDDDDWKSPWRNRRPSPGQWMEPVESFE